MNRSLFFALFILSVVLLSSSCKRQKVEQTRYLTYKANPSYTGAHPTAGVESNIYIIDKKSYMQMQIDLIGVDINKNYQLQIHAWDTTKLFGYSDDPVINLGVIANGLPVNTQVDVILFDDFTQNFKGYYLIHDPDNVIKDTSSLLIFGKIGSEW